MLISRNLAYKIPEQGERPVYNINFDGKQNFV